MDAKARTLFRLPGTYPPQDDTWLLAEVLRTSGAATGARVLDLCTGTGALAVAAAAAGAAEVHAIDLSWRSVLSVRANSILRRAGVRAYRGDLFAPVAGRRFDLVLANPPYVPAPNEALPRHRQGRCWDAGLDGRVLVDRICAGVADVLAPGGHLLLVHSCVTGEQQTLAQLQQVGLSADVVARATIPFGPVMRQRGELLRARGLLPDGANVEDIVVIEASQTFFAGRPVPEPEAA